MKKLFKALYWFLIGRLSQVKERANRLFIFFPLIAGLLIQGYAHASLEPHKGSDERVFYPVPEEQQMYYQICMGTGEFIEGAKDKRQGHDLNACAQFGLSWVEVRDTASGALLYMIFKNKQEGRILLGLWGIEE
jgi:hypothetical protein